MTNPNPGPDTEGLIEAHRDLEISHGTRSDVASRELSKLHKNTADALQALQGQVRELKDQHYQIMLLVCGGEDAPGFAASLGVKDVEQIMQQNREFSEYDTATIARLRDVLERQKVWHEEHEKILSKAEPTRATIWRRCEHEEEIEIIDSALTNPDIGTPEKEKTDAG